MAVSLDDHTPLDLLIRGGEVPRRRSNATDRIDIGVRNGLIAEMATHIDTRDARVVLDCGGRVVTPGLIDLHTHVYDGVTPMGIDPDVIGFSGGVTTLCDAGSAGAPGISGLVRYVAEPARVRVLGMVNWSRLGLVGSQAAGELEDARYADPDGVASVIAGFPDFVRGVKIRISREMTGGPSLRFVRAAGEVAHAARRPLHLHIGHSEEAIAEVVDQLSPGDMITHYQTPKRPSLVDERLRLVAGMREARERGILFDSGHGKTHFDFAIARSLLDQDFPPDTLSSDISRTSYESMAPGVLTVANKWWALGLSLGEVVDAMTRAAADWLIPAGGLGRLEVGAVADIALFDRVVGTRTFTDSSGANLAANEWLEPWATVSGGRVAWRADEQIERYKGQSG